MKKNSKKKAALIALIVSLVVLLLVIAATLIYEKLMFVQFDLKGLIIADAIGFLIVYAIVYHYEKPPKDDM